MSQVPDVEAIRLALGRAFPQAAIEVRDDSAAHAGHAGARAGGHFRVSVVSNRFAGVPTRERHRMIYAALGDWMGQGIHALSIEALLPMERK